MNNQIYQNRLVLKGSGTLEAEGKPGHGNMYFYMWYNPVETALPEKKEM